MRIRRTLLAFLIASASSACALLVPAELGSVSCREEGAVGEPSCARGELCQGGECRRCAQRDTCGDGLDNDCNGTPDDGCDEPTAGASGADVGESGQAGAGLGGGAGNQASGAGGKAGAGGKSGAGGKGGAGGKAGKAGAAGVAGVAGMAGTASAGTSGASSGEGGTFGGVGATGGVGGGGATAGVRDGQPCEADAECSGRARCSTFGELGAVGPGTAPADKAVCSRACRTSMDCLGSDAICQPTPVGTGVCVAAADVGRGPTGVLSVGQPCTDASQCRSAWCDGDVCRDTCATSADCNGPAPNTKCVAEKGIPGAPDQVARRCTAAVGVKGPDAPCVEAEECVENDCRTLDATATLVFPGYSCTEACCTTDDCASATFNVGGPDVTFFRVCSYEGGMRACSTGNSIVGKGLLGETCKGNGDCRSLFCLTGRCSDTCCSDSSCETLAQEGLRCLPTQVLGNWQLRCRLP